MRSIRRETHGPASAFATSAGQAGRSIGRQLEGSFTWNAIPNRLTFESGFAQLTAGRFFRETAGAAFRGDPMYVYTMVTTTFGGRDRAR